MGTQTGITNYANDQYYGSLFWGSASQEIDMILDSGSSKCWLPMTTCSDRECVNDKYYSRSSSSYVYGATEATLTYGSGSVTGTWNTDRVCLDAAAENCSVDTFKFLGVSSATGMEVLRASGLCGMKPDLGDSDTYQLVPKLKANGAIDKSQFTMHLRDIGTDSWIEFGTTSDDFQYSWTYLTSNPTLWSTMLRETNTGSTVSGAIWDSGTSNSYLPQTDLDGVVDWLNSELSSDNDCEIIDYIITCPCSSSPDFDSYFPILEITTGSSSDPLLMKIKGSDYMYYSSSDRVCYSYLRTNADFADVGYWLLGLNFYRAFEISHDLETYKIGFKALGASTVESVNTNENIEEDYAKLNFRCGMMALIAVGFIAY